MNIKLRIKAITIILIIFLIFMGMPMVFELTSVHSTVEATTIRYVGGTGPGNYSKIQDAIDNANSGDIIRVYAGPYYENVVINKPVTLIGNGTGNTIINGGGSGDVVHVTADWVNITKFSIRNSGSDWYDAGIEIYYSDHCKIEYCNFHNNERGIYLEYSSYNIIRNNSCDSNPWREGIQLSYSSNNFFENNIISNNWDGILLSSSSSNTFTNNIFSNNQEAIAIDLSSDNILYNNSMSSCGLRIFGVSLSEWNTHTISANNTVNGKPIYYWKNRNGGTIPSGAGQIILANCNNVRVENQNINDGSVGIQLGFSDDNIILNNTCKFHNWAGIEVRWSANNLIKNNICSDISWGIMLSVSSDNIIKNNTISNNGIEGMSINSGSGNIITNNHFTSNDVGIDISSDDNYIYYNNFKSNDQPATNDGSNYWHNNQEEGNYWDDYNGNDNGANGRIEGDGIGDTNIPHLNLDKYPFIKSSGWLFPGTPIILDPGDVDLNGEYTIFWDENRGTTGYILEEDESEIFDSSAIIYEGSKLYTQIKGKNNETYYYRLRAYNDQFESEWSNTVDIVVDWPPDIPQNLMVSVYPEGNAINLSWDHNLIDTKEYDIYYKTTGSWGLLDTIIHPINTYNHTELIDGDHYYYRIQARDFRGQLSDFSDIVDAIPVDIVAPSPPVGLIINVLSYNSILLNWEANPEDDVQGYHVYRSITPVTTDWGDPINGAMLIQQLDYTDQNLVEHTTYYYAITAVDEASHESDYSKVINATTLLDQHGPEINNSLADFEIPEDSYDDTSINLYQWFKDINGDTLIFSCKGEDHIEVTIFQKNGTVILKPEKNWNGVERLTFYASDKDKETDDRIKITVTEVNDPPEQCEIITPNGNIKIDDGDLLDFEALCDDPDIKYGDELDFNWSSNITGEIGKGNPLSDIVLPIGRHLITLEVSDKIGETSIDTIMVWVIETPESDSDEDGIPNIWERDHGLNLKDPSDAYDDPDKDGKTNLEEYLTGTDPTIKDVKDDEGMDYSVDIIGAIIAMIAVIIIIIIFLFVIKPKIDKIVMKDEVGEDQGRRRLLSKKTPYLKNLQSKPRALSYSQAPIPKIKSESPKPSMQRPVPKVEGQRQAVIPINQKVVALTVSQPTIVDEAEMGKDLDE